MTTSDPYPLLDSLTRLESIRRPDPDNAQRRVRRFTVRAEVMLHSLDSRHVETDPIHAMLRDISQAGAGLVSQTEIQPLSNWRMDVLHQEFAIARLAFIVRHCQSVEGKVFLLGGTFGVEPGLLGVLGVDPRSILDSDDLDGDSAFVAPSDV